MERYQTPAIFAEELKPAVQANDRLDIILHRVNKGFFVTIPNSGANPILAVALPEGRVHQISPTLSIQGPKTTLKGIKQELPRFLTTFYGFSGEVRIFTSKKRFRQNKPSAKISAALISRQGKRSQEVPSVSL